MQVEKGQRPKACYICVVSFLSITDQTLSRGSSCLCSVLEVII